MSSDILLKSIKSDFAAELKNNKKLAELIKKATDGKGTFTDVSQFSAACGEALSDVLAKNITLDMLRDGSVSYEDINTILQDTLRQNYELVNRMAQAVQKQTDAKLNVHIEPQKAEFPTERVSRIASALIDKTDSDEQLRRRMRSPIENITDSFYSDYVEVNADKRSRAGMRTYLIRQTNGKCCAWCSSLAGRYDYPNGAPENIFSRHDNCTCTVDYITDKHRQDVWSKRKYALTPEQRERILANAPPPTRFTHAQAQQIQENVLNRLANSGDSGIIKSNDSSDTILPIIAEHALSLQYFHDENLNNTVEQTANRILEEARNHKVGTEIAYTISAEPPYKTSEPIYGGEGEMAVVIPKSESPSITIHNHPSGGTFSSKDIQRFVVDGKAKATCVIGNNGNWYILEKTDSFDWISFQTRVFDISDSDDFAKIILEGAEKYGFQYYQKID